MSKKRIYRELSDATKEKISQELSNLAESHSRRENTSKAMTEYWKTVNSKNMTITNEDVLNLFLDNTFTKAQKKEIEELIVKWFCSINNCEDEELLRQSFSQTLTNIVAHKKTKEWVDLSFIEVKNLIEMYKTKNKINIK